MDPSININKIGSAINEIIELITKDPLGKDKEINDDLTKRINELVKMPLNKNDVELRTKFYDLKEKLNNKKELSSNFDRVNAVIIETWPLPELPKEIWGEIMPRMEKEQLKPTFLISKIVNSNQDAAAKKLIDSRELPLVELGIKTAKQAIDYAIRLQLDVVNLYCFPDLTLEDLEKLAKEPKKEELIGNQKLLHEEKKMRNLNRNLMTRQNASNFYPTITAG